MFGFSVGGFNGFLKNLGQQATWERASICPDRSHRTGGTNPKCVVCQGRGHLWSAPQDVTVGFTSMQTVREFGTLSQWEQGDGIVTIGSDSPAYGAGDFDRLTLTNAIVRVCHVLTRGSNDKLKYRFPVAILEVWAIVASAKVVLVKDTDFTLSGNTITWITNTVQLEQNYTVLYTARPEYFVYRDWLQDRPHQRGLALPRKVHVRLMELMNRAVA